MNRFDLGKIGEAAAADFLAGNGYKILVRNFRSRYGEIDLICRDKATVVFVEVKTKTGGMSGSPEEMFTRVKCAKVRKMAEVYLQGKSAICRIDMVAVETGLNGEVVEIRHYQNAGAER